MTNAEYTHIAGTILRDSQDRYLMIQERLPSAYGLWNIPAGHQDSDETEQEAAVRETYEETGLKVELLDGHPINSETSQEGGHKYFAFLGKIVDGELKIQETEILNAKWMAFPEIKQLYEDGKVRSPWIMNSIQKAEDAYSRH